MLTGHPEKWSTDIEVNDPDGKRFSGTLSVITANPAEAVREADVILLCVPGYLIESKLKEIKPYISTSTLVGSIVSSTGFFFFAHKILDTDQSLFGFQRVPYISRFREYGRTGDLLGYKPMLNVAIEGVSEPEQTRRLLEKLFMTRVNVLNNFYEASLTNSNPILHTGRLYSMWKNYGGEIYEHPILFYKDWTDEASEYIIRMDEEFQQLLRHLDIPSGTIPTLLDYYDSWDPASLTKKIKSIPAFRNIPAPMIKLGHGWIPDFESRYFTEDFPYGLRFIKDLAESNGLKVNLISKVFDWGFNWMGKIEKSSFL